jgi:hypothetical protein
MSWLSWDYFVKLLGVLGFVISVWTAVGAIRNRTVFPQPQLLAELRGYLDVAHRTCSHLGVQLNFDKSLLESGHKPNVLPRPAEFDEAIKRMPELGFTITSIGQRQIVLLHMLITSVNGDWIALESCLNSDPVSMTALECARRLRRQCLIIGKFFPNYVDAITRINKGKLWNRFKYRDHSSITYKLFRWTPLQPAVIEYERTLVALQGAL